MRWKHELTYALLGYVTTKQKVMSSVSQRNTTGILKGLFKLLFPQLRKAGGEKTLLFHDTANPQSPKHLVWILLAEPEVLVTRLLCMVTEPKAGHEFNQRSDLIWKFLQMPLSRKKQIIYSITHSNEGLRQENSYNPLQIFSHWCLWALGMDDLF